MRYFDIKGCNISSCAVSDWTARVQPNRIQLEYLWFCSHKIDVFSLMCAAKISVFSYLFALVYGDINLFCLVFAYLILLCN